MHQKIRSKALDLLARREHSQLELRNKLIAKGFLDKEVDNVISNLVKENLQSNERFIENYVRSRLNRGYGPLRIQLELQNRGISKSNIDINDDIWFNTAIKIRQKKFGIDIPTDSRTKEKQRRFLQYKGFTNDQIKCALTS